MKYVIEIDEEEYKLFERDCINNRWRKTIEKAKPLQTELEKIKAELQTEKDKSNNTYYAMKSVGLSTAIKIIDKRIAELKGEQE